MVSLFFVLSGCANIPSKERHHISVRYSNTPETLQWLRVLTAEQKF